MQTFKEFSDDREARFAAQRADYERRISQPIPPITSLHTKVLLNMLAIARRTIAGGKVNPNMGDWMGGGREYDIVAGSRLHQGNKDGYTYDEIKSELATREHIPNKKEAKIIRQQRGRR